MDTKHPILSVADIADKLKVDPDTVRRLFGAEPGVVVLDHPTPGKRVYRTLRVPPPVLLRVLTRLTLESQWTLEQLDEPIFTPDEIADTLKLGVSTIRRLFVREAGVVTICFPRPATRAYRTLRIPQRTLANVMQRLTLQPTVEPDAPSNDVPLFAAAGTPLIRSPRAHVRRRRSQFASTLRLDQPSRNSPSAERP